MGVGGSYKAPLPGDELGLSLAWTRHRGAPFLILEDLGEHFDWGSEPIGHL